MTTPAPPQRIAGSHPGTVWWIPVTVISQRPPDTSSRSGHETTPWHVEVATPGEPHAVVALDDHDLTAGISGPHMADIVRALSIFADRAVATHGSQFTPLGALITVGGLPADLAARILHLAGETTT